jgi:hypothetical protein
MLSKNKGDAENGAAFQDPGPPQAEAPARRAAPNTLGVRARVSPVEAADLADALMDLVTPREVGRPTLLVSRDALTEIDEDFVDVPAQFVRDQVRLHGEWYVVDSCVRYVPHLTLTPLLFCFPGSSRVQRV